MMANKAVASANANANAKPDMTYENNWPFNERFIATPNINAPNYTPLIIYITPAPIEPVVVNPVPLIFAASIICFII